MTHPLLQPSATLVKQSGKDCRALRWDPMSARLWWVDSANGCVLTSDVRGAALAKRGLVDLVYTLAPCRSGHLLAGLSKRLSLVNLSVTGRLRVPQSRVLSAIDVFESRTVISAGRTDRSGYFVFGTRNLAADQRAIGSFFQYSREFGLRRLALPTVVAAASIGFSADGARMFFAGGAGSTLYQCDYDARQATVTGIRPFARAAGAVLSDAIVDRHDHVWSAQEGAGGAGVLVQYRPDGAVAQTVTLAGEPAISLAAAGAQLDQLVYLDRHGGVRSLPLTIHGTADTPFDDGAASQVSTVFTRKDEHQ